MDMKFQMLKGVWLRDDLGVGGERDCLAVAVLDVLRTTNQGSGFRVQGSAVENVLHPPPQSSAKRKKRICFKIFGPEHQEQILVLTVLYVPQYQ